MVNGILPEVPPPGEGLNTVICVPENEYGEKGKKKSDGTIALNCVLFTRVVGRPAPFHCTIDPSTKPEPLTVNVIEGLNNGAMDGEIEFSTGVGLLGGVGAAVCQRIDVPADTKFRPGLLQSTPLVGDGWTPIVAVWP